MSGLEVILPCNKNLGPQIDAESAILQATSELELKPSVGGRSQLDAEMAAGGKNEVGTGTLQDKDSGDGENCPNVRNGAQTTKSNLQPRQQHMNNMKGNKRKKRRQNKKRKYKPYSKLSWQERRELEDRETKRANRVREEMFAHGQPVAPYNTTQFLMEDHNDLADLDSQLIMVGRRGGGRARESSISQDDSELGDEEFYSSPEDEEEFLTREFSTAYEDLHAERLNSMSKAELIAECRGLEARADSLERRLRELSGARGVSDGEVGGESESDVQPVTKDLCDENTQNADDDAVDTEESDKMRNLRMELARLTEENERLRAENESLRLGKTVDAHCEAGGEVEMAEVDENPSGSPSQSMSSSSSSSTTSVDSDSDSTASTASCCTSRCECRSSPERDATIPSDRPDPDDALQEDDGADLPMLNGVHQEEGDPDPVDCDARADDPDPIP
ncbi:protein HEXIM1 [Ischnura elegans]|uniref:protein HEXIM1 n=1 Tax=Ischnura elegans TaxID=197161 RepID=UPI001ED8A58C|nr:protein HEXIM1 [Ischnura elegans]